MGVSWGCHGGVMGVDPHYAQRLSLLFKNAKNIQVRQLIREKHAKTLCKVGGGAPGVLPERSRNSRSAPGILGALPEF